MSEDKEERYNFGKNKIIYEDPSWRYQNWSMESKAVQGEKWGRANGRSPYDCLDDSDLFSLPISKLADKDAVRLTWATFPKLETAINYIGAEKRINNKGKEIPVWTYKTVLFTWIKLNKCYQERMQGMWDKEDQYTYQEILERALFPGSGFYSKANVELLLLSTRGKGVEILNRSIRQPILEPVSHHSAKPPIVRSKILAIFGCLPRIELFARGLIPTGWLGTGLEYDGVDVRELLK